jgi:hypothetical protein
MTNARINGRKLVWTGGIVLVLAAASARLFAVFYLKDMNHPAVPATQPVTQTAAPVAGGP